MYTIRKKYRVEYSHQLDKAYSTACSDTIHGHSGIIELFFQSEELDDTNMVVDFGEISSFIKPFIMQSYDHSLYIPMSMDNEYKDMLIKYNKKLFICSENPTAEYFAREIYNKIVQLLEDNNKTMITLQKVRFHETESGWAEYSYLSEDFNCNCNCEST